METASPSSRPQPGSDPQPFRHVFLTRFSVRFTEDQPPADEGWLRYRLGFFDQAAVASMRSQTMRPDAWLVFCDSSAPQWLREELEELSIDTFTLVWVDRPWAHGVPEQAVRPLADRDFLITTRFDSDDALGREFVALVQAEFAGQRGEYVNLLRGLQVDRSGQVFSSNDPVNPFISFIERVDGELKTVFQSFQHPQSRRFAPVRNVVARPAWVQVVHGGNVVNEIQGPRVSPAVARRCVEMDLPYDTDVPALRVALQWAKSWGRLLRLWAKHPSRARHYLEGLLLRLRGTKTLPRLP